MKKIAPFRPGQSVDAPRLNAIRERVQRPGAVPAGVDDLGGQTSGRFPFNDLARLAVLSDEVLEEFSVTGLQVTSAANPSNYLEFISKTSNNPASPVLCQNDSSSIPAGYPFRAYPIGTTKPVLCLAGNPPPKVMSPCGVGEDRALVDERAGFICLSPVLDYQQYKVVWAIRNNMPFTAEVELTSDLAPFARYSESATTATAKVKYRKDDKSFADVPNPAIGDGTGIWEVTIIGGGSAKSTGDIVTVTEKLGIGLQVLETSSPLKIGTVDADIAAGSDGTITLIYESGSAGTLEVKNPHEVVFEAGLTVMAFDVQGWSKPLIGVFEWALCSELEATP
jgi:hypothetical protein